MTETITTDTRYGFDDMRVGDIVRIQSGELAVEGKVTHAGYAKEPVVQTLAGAWKPNREGCTFTLRHRPDPVADLVRVWTEGDPDDKVIQMMRGNARETVRGHWPLLADALDQLWLSTQAQA